MHPGGWGKPPVDEYGRPLYGDVFGVMGQYGDGGMGEEVSCLFCGVGCVVVEGVGRRDGSTHAFFYAHYQVNRVHWGELEYEEEEEEEVRPTCLECRYACMFGGGIVSASVSALLD